MIKYQAAIRHALDWMEAAGVGYTPAARQLRDALKEQTTCLTLTKREADDVDRVLAGRAASLKVLIKGLPRKRTWAPSVKAMTLADWTSQLQTIEMLRKRIETAYASLPDTMEGKGLTTCDMLDDSDRRGE